MHRERKQHLFGLRIDIRLSSDKFKLQLFIVQLAERTIQQWVFFFSFSRAQGNVKREIVLFFSEYFTILYQQHFFVRRSFVCCVCLYIAQHVCRVLILAQAHHCCWLYPTYIYFSSSSECNLSGEAVIMPSHIRGALILICLHLQKAWRRKRNLVGSCCHTTHGIHSTLFCVSIGLK